MTEELWQRACGLMDEGRWQEARVIWEDLVRQQPDNALAANKLGVCRAELGDTAGAEDAFRLALELEPKMPQALSNLGNIELTRGNTSSAAEYYQQAIKADPDYAIAHKNLSIAYKKLGQIEKSVAELKRAHALGSRSSKPRGYGAPDDKPVRGGFGLWSCLFWALLIAAFVYILVVLR